MAEAKEAKKVIVLGIDGGHPELIKRFVGEGKLPNFDKMMKKGIFKEIIEPLPTITPPNWTTITTGAWPGTHGITDFYLPNEPEESLDKTHLGIDTRKCRAEYIWQAAERAGKKPILIKWEVSWPPCHNGLQIEGCGPGVVNYFELGPVRLHTTEELPLTDLLRLKPAEGWQNLDPKWEALEGRVVLSLYGGNEHTYQLLVAKSKGSGYDTVLVCKEKDAAQPVASMRSGQWSEWVTDTFDMTVDQEKMAQRVADRAKLRASDRRGKEDIQVRATLEQRTREGLMPQGNTKGTFRFKLMNLNRDGGEMELFSTQLWPVSGYTQPLELGEELYENVGPFFTNPARDALHYEWIDERTYYELQDYQHQWLAKAARYLTSTKPWDLLYVETHCGDYINHFYMQQFDPDIASEAQIRNATSWYTRHYQSIDRMLGELMSLADEDTLVAVVSDHSATPSPWGVIDPNKALEEAGLLVYKNVDGKRVVDWSQTKGFVQRTIHAYVNLKGRDIDGIVDPADYDKVQEEIVEAMKSYRHPKSGKHAFQIVLKKHEAELIGHYGDRVGDVIFAVRPEADGEHGRELPTSRVKDISIRSIFFLAGPNVKEGLHLKGMAYLTSVAPTIAYLIGIPMPHQAEGAILYEALVDPDLRLNLQRKAEAEATKWQELYQKVAAEKGLDPNPAVEA
ncbi:MAG: alkaline phosphatase family protein [Chloroflexi bacterium]|nr:alkaline phosphatase family protein [Chloroflexota bacterium]MCL5107277.1 alkaline phosphatase family protein [Chloroflexota bacterium]